MFVVFFAFRSQMRKNPISPLYRPIITGFSDSIVGILQDYIELLYATIGISGYVTWPFDFRSINYFVNQKLHYCPIMWISKSRVTSYELRVASYNIKITSYELKSTSYNIKSTSYNIRITSYELQHNNHELRHILAEFQKNRRFQA